VFRRRFINAALKLSPGWADAYSIGKYGLFPFPDCPLEFAGRFNSARRMTAEQA